MKYHLILLQTMWKDFRWCFIFTSNVLAWFHHIWTKINKNEPPHTIFKPLDHQNLVISIKFLQKNVYSENIWRYLMFYKQYMLFPNFVKSYANSSQKNATLCQNKGPSWKDFTGTLKNEKFTSFYPYTVIFRALTPL